MTRTVPRYNTVATTVYDDAGFCALSPEGQYLWLALLIGPWRTNLPGLEMVGAAALAETIRRPIKAVRAALAEIVAAGMAEVDEGRRVIRLPRAPRYDPCRSDKTLKGWFTAWSSIPDCSLKFAHVAALKDACDFGKPNMLETWAVTFGTVASPSPSTFEAPSQGPTQGPSISTTTTSSKPTTGTSSTPTTLPPAAGESASGEPLSLALEVQEPEADRLTPDRLADLWTLHAVGGKGTIKRPLPATVASAATKKIASRPTAAEWLPILEKVAKLRTTTQGKAFFDFPTFITATRDGGEIPDRVEAGKYDFWLDARKRDSSTGYIGAEAGTHHKEGDCDL